MTFIEQRVTAGPLNFRRYPLLEPAAVLRQLAKGTRVRVVKGVQFTANGLTWVFAEYAGQHGVLAAQYLASPEPSAQVLRGVNIDPRNPTANPPARQLRGLGYVRFVLNNFDGQRVQTLDEMLAVYQPIISSLLDEAITPVLVVNWQTAGQGELPDYNDKRRVAEFLAARLRLLVERLPEAVVWQIWNEGDGVIGSVPVTAAEYALILDQAVATIRSVRARARIWSQGHVTNRPAYWTAVRQASRWADTLDSVCIHPYMQGDARAFPELVRYGPIEPTISQWRAVLAPSQQLVATEHGVLDSPTANHDRVAAYAKDFLARAAGLHAALWFAWGDQANGYPMAHNLALQGVYGLNPEQPPDPQPEPGPSGGNSRSFGFNFVGPGAAHSLAEAQRLFRAAGKRLGPVCIINQPEACLGLDSVWVFYRIHNGDGRSEPDPFTWRDGEWTAQGWWNFWWPQLRIATREPGRQLAYIFHNELGWRGQIDRRVAWERQLMNIAHQAGVTITYGNFAVAGFDPQDIPALLPMVRQGATQGHILRANTYVFPPPYDGPRLFQYVRPLVEAVPQARWVYGEVGWAERDAQYQGPVALAELCNRAAESTGQHPGFIGHMLWCFSGSGGGWSHSHIPESDIPIVVNAAL